MINIPVYIFLLSAIIIFLIAIELKYKTKGVCAILAGLVECSVVALCFVSGVTVLEQLFLAVITALIIMSLIVFAKHNEVK